MLPRRVAILALALTAVLASGAAAQPPAYSIVDLGIVQPTDAASQAFRVSRNGVATGRSFGNPTFAFTWSQSGGLTGLPNLASPARAFSVGNGLNDDGIVVGTGATTTFGSSPLPLVWDHGLVAQLPLPAGQTLGRANDVNAAGVAVGSVGSGSLEFGVVYSGGTATVITHTTSTGCFLRTAFSISDGGRIVGFGIDPNDAARNVGFVYDLATATAFEVGALPGMDGALAFDVSDAGHIVGSSMLHQGAGLPFRWTSGGGMQPIPLPVGTSQGSARGVNSDGWVVGTASSAFAIPFLFDGSTTWRLADLLPPGTGWDLSTNTSSSAMGISDDGIIVGTGIHNGLTRAYAMIPERPTATLLVRFDALGRGDGIEVSWQLADPGAWSVVTLERAPSPDGPWQAVSAVTLESDGGLQVLDTEAPAGAASWYRLDAVDRAGQQQVLGLATSSRPLGLGLAFRSRGANPTSGPARLQFELPRAQSVRLEVFDVRGRRVRTLLDGNADAAVHHVTWDATDARGVRCEPGLYLARLRTAEGTRTLRLLLRR